MGRWGRGEVGNKREDVCVWGGGGVQGGGGGLHPSLSTSSQLCVDYELLKLITLCMQSDVGVAPWCGGLEIDSDA